MEEYEKEQELHGIREKRGKSKGTLRTNGVVVHTVSTRYDSRDSNQITIVGIRYLVPRDR